ncbi:Regulator of nonsense transcripts 2 [Podosphaera aphanis]|nr:Regulator of nonsense transcripts 2 [Podosphaera aphanis]
MERKRKRVLRDLNSRAWNGEKEIYDLSNSLDSSLKKNTAFIKRLKTSISPATLSTFLQDIRTLILHKYLSEIISACYEGLCRLKSPGEIQAGVEIVSALHQRFGPIEFTEYLGWYFGKGLATPDKSHLKNLPTEAREKTEKERITRQRVLLRVVTELWLVGVLRTLDDVSRPDDTSRGKESLTTGLGKISEGNKTKTNSINKAGAVDPFPLEILKDLLGYDREHVNLPLLVVFVKAFGWDILGIKETSPDGQKNSDEDDNNKIINGNEAEDEVTEDLILFDNAPEDPPLVSPELQERFRSILRRYFEDVKAHLIRDQKAISKQARRDAEAYVKSGQVFEDRQASLEKIVKSQERLASNAQFLADAVGADMPDLKDSEDRTNPGNGGIGLVKTGEYLRADSDGSGIWEDEEERRFYENLVDLKGKVPSMFLEDVKKKKPDADECTSKQAENNDSTCDISPPSNRESMSTTINNMTVGVQVDVLLARLPELINKDLTDQAAIDFCFLNSKASRNRLVKAVQEIPKGRSDLLPTYARLVATLGKYMPDITKSLVDYLDHEFRSLQRRKEKEFLGQARLGNIRYLAELTKFGVVPEHVIFYCLKVGLDDFSRMNIEIICNLLENCGRFLLRNPETSPRMSSFLETLKRKKAVQNIGQQERMLIENAVYYVDPPVRATIGQKERTPIELFIRKLIYLDMNNRNYTKVLKQIRRLHWEEIEVVAVLEKIFSKPGKVKYSNIHLLAILASTLYRHHQDFVVTIIDNLLEYITLGLEQNDFKFNQRRIAEVKYLAELYNYRMVDHPVIFDTLYRIMTFGHGGPPVPGRLNPFDMPDDFFRIRLAATILETCGGFFMRGTPGKKLDYFLSFLQYYIYTKDPLPMDIEFIVQDVFALTRPQWKLASNFEEASKVFHLAVVQDQKTSGVEKVVEPEELDSDSTSDGANGDNQAEAETPEKNLGGSLESDEEHGAELNDTHHSPSPHTEPEEEDIVVTRQEETVDPKYEAEFEREFAKMMAESLDSRKHERKSTFDVPLPMKRKDNTGNGDSWADDSINDNTNSSGKMVFSLLTKRGNRPQTRTVELPSDSTLAIAMKTQQKAERAEQQRIKDLVLNYELHDGEEQDGDSTLNSAPTDSFVHNRTAGLEKSATMNITRLDKSSNSRSGQRARKLHLSDVDWYGSQQKSFSNTDQVTLTLANGNMPLAKNKRNPPAPSTADLCLRKATPRLTRKSILESHKARTVDSNGMK